MGELPRQIGRYRVEGVLGSGAMGNVYLAHDPELDRRVAIKTVRATDLRPDELEVFLTRFRNEARAAARLHHPSIVSVYDFGQDDSVGPYLVFEHVDGPTLNEVLKAQGQLSPSEVAAIAREVGDALDTAHQQGIIHRDIKPENLLVAPTGRAKLADFGVARVPNAVLTREGQFLGTPCYSAPETLSGGHYSAQSDLFSFSAVLYELISGHRAFPGDEAVAVAHRVIHEEPLPPSKVARHLRLPEQLDAIVMRGLAKDPAHRFGSAREISDAIAQALGDPTGRAISMTGVPVRAAARPPPNPDRSGMFAFVAILVGGLSVGIAMVVAFGNDEAPNEQALGLGADAGLPTAPRAKPANRQAGENHRLAAGKEGDDELPGRGSDAGVHAGATRLPTDVNEPSGAADGGASLGSFEREEAAKDALARVRMHLQAGNAAGARAALGEARKLDPGNPDIARLGARIADGGVD